MGRAELGGAGRRVPSSAQTSSPRAPPRSGASACPPSPETGVARRPAPQGRLARRRRPALRGALRLVGFAPDGTRRPAPPSPALTLRPRSRDLAARVFLRRYITERRRVGQGASPVDPYLLRVAEAKNQILVARHEWPMRVASQRGPRGPPCLGGSLRRPLPRNPRTYHPVPDGRRSDRRQASGGSHAPGPGAADSTAPEALRSRSGSTDGRA